MKEIILIKNGEVVLKGLNRGNFEAAMLRTIKKRLQSLGEAEIKKSQSTVYVSPLSDDYDFEEAVDRVSKIFGISAFSRACVAEKNIEDICQKAGVYLENVLSSVKTFKVEAKRADKAFPLKSPEICERLGEYLLDKFPHLSVDVHKPEVTVLAEVRDFGAYVHAGQLQGAGGMPAGTAGRSAILISGGIDSPVAAWMMARRGLSLTAVHFASPPYTGPKAEQKVRDLLTQVSKYSGRIPLYIVPFTEIQVEISKKCPEELFTVIMRRFMMRVAEVIARRDHCKALITGESLGQVASQTLDAITCTEKVCTMPVFRPLIGNDKREIVEISRKIGTFDISILPFEDCCTVFTPKHPRTKPPLNIIESAEKNLDIDGLVERAAANAFEEIIEAF